MSTIVALGLFLLLAMFLVGGRRGIRSFVSLLLNFVLLFMAIVLVAFGFPPLIVTLIIGIMILGVTIFMGADSDLTTQTAFYGAVIVLVIVVLLIIPVEHWAAVQGFGEEDSDDIVGFSLAIGISFAQIAASTAIFSTLGAIAEAAMAIAAGLNEIVVQTPHLSNHELFQDGSDIGRQIIGTTFNTLFFGFFGGFLALFIWFVGLHYSLGQIFNNKIFVAELLEILFSIIGVILTVPITTWVMTRQRHD
ncbi:integral membrane protein [Lactobacillus selangorensis]|uniref:Integral membrane protein n=1 Tax=Lactobacillus selangorensis TaxID=81857 RepID=A0A0R2FK55_9LACO|nr:YibE/F family protein [Lactobacillus selangorensis]KRN28944.1 integral membrane protein [Lactobacillus selangorensis]KRN32646.1 integral membrane protein [Lactobacillus selangorensis]